MSAPRAASTIRLATLMERQPAGLRRREEFQQLSAMIARSPKLARTRLNRRAARLLDQARIAPENLKNFYRTYRIPESSFYPRFVTLKRGYIDRLTELKEARRRFIVARVAALPGPLFALLRELGRYEQRLNRAGRTPVWDAVIFPRTKKEAQALGERSIDEWNGKIAAFGRSLEERYPGRVTADWSCAWAALILDCPLETPPSAQTVKRNYRRLSKRYHPDAGGDPVMFRRLKEARDQLLDQASGAGTARSGPKR